MADHSSEGKQADASRQEGPRFVSKFLVGFSLFAALTWIAVLSILTIRLANPEIVSRPQLLAAPLVVEGNLRHSPPRVQVTKVWWGSLDLADRELPLSGLQISEERNVILAIQPAPAGGYRVFETPEDPAFARWDGQSAFANPAPIYSADDPLVKSQVESILAERAKP